MSKPKPSAAATKAAAKAKAAAALAAYDKALGLTPNGLTPGQAAAGSAAAANNNIWDKPSATEPQTNFPFDPRINRIGVNGTQASGAFTQGVQVTSGSMTSQGLDGKNYSCSFQFNPTELDISYGFDSSAAAMLNPSFLAAGDTDSGQGLMLNQSISFQLLFDRTYEVWTGMHYDKSAYASQQNDKLNQLNAKAAASKAKAKVSAAAAAAALVKAKAALAAAKLAADHSAQTAEVGDQGDAAKQQAAAQAAVAAAQSAETKAQSVVSAAASAKATALATSDSSAAAVQASTAANVNGPYKYGVMWDVWAIERMCGIFGQFSGKAPSGPPAASIVQVQFGLDVIGSGLLTTKLGEGRGGFAFGFTGWMTSLEVQYTRFDASMVPTRASVALSFQQIYSNAATSTPAAATTPAAAANPAPIPPTKSTPETKKPTKKPNQSGPGRYGGGKGGESPA